MRYRTKACAVTVSAFHALNIASALGPVNCLINLITPYTTAIA